MANAEMSAAQATRQCIYQCVVGVCQGQITCVFSMLQHMNLKIDIKAESKIGYCQTWDMLASSMCAYSGLYRNFGLLGLSIGLTSIEVKLIFTVGVQDISYTFAVCTHKRISMRYHALCTVIKILVCKRKSKISGIL